MEIADSRNTIRISVICKCDSTGNKKAATCDRNENIAYPMFTKEACDIEASYISAMGEERAGMYPLKELLGCTCSAGLLALQFTLVLTLSEQSICFF